VPGGDRTNIENVFERQQQFNVQLHAGQPFALDFEFGIPAKWCPTYASNNASVAWRVNATLDLPWKKDVHAWQTVRIFNGAPRATQTQASTHEAQLPSTEPSPQQPIDLQEPAPSTVSNEAATPKFCRQCGTPLVAGALFCGNCGAQVAR